MAVLDIRTVPDPVLRQRAKRVSIFDASLRRLARDMIDTMHHARGVGLAANQVGSLLRVIVVQLPEEEEPTVLVNPQITLREGEREVEEGCLSIPGYKGLVKRSERVQARGRDLNGRPIRIKGEGLLAQVLEHEIDHLDGTLYIDRLVSREKLWKVEPEEEPVEAAAR